jgi:nitrous oxidase accessory protein NosD
VRGADAISRTRVPADRRPLRRRAGAVTAAVLLGLAACTSGNDEAGSAGSAPTASPDGDPTTQAAPPTGTAPPTTAGPPTAATPSPAGCDGRQVVEVADAAGLRRALERARPGQIIRVADGRYEGTFVASAQADASNPISLCGSRDAVLDGGDIDGDYTLHLSGATHWQVSGLTVTGGKKGVMVDAGVGIRLEGLLVTSTGDEAIHLRTDSTDNAVVGNTIRDTGLRKPQFGEGIYIGTSESNWCQWTGCRPDRSDRNLVEGNDIAGTTAEAVDIKEGTEGGVLRGNTFDGSAMVEADSWVDVKGNGWTVEENVGTASPEDGFQVHELVDGWGRDNVFAGNTARGVPGLAINVAGPRAIRDTTTVTCDNVVDAGAGQLSNVSCSARR